MKNLATPLLCLILLFACGCQTDNALKTFADVQDTYIATVDQVIALKQADKIDQDDYDRYVLPAIEAGDEILDRYYAHLVATGDNPDESVVTALLADLRAVLARLTPYLVKG